MKHYHIAYDWARFESYRTAKVKGLRTGFKNIDASIFGLPNLIVVQGEPKCYKSTFILNVAINRLKKGTPVLLIDKENGLQRTRVRSLCYLGGIPYKFFEEPSLFDSDSKMQQRYQQAITQLNKLPFYYINHGLEQEVITELLMFLRNKYKKKVLLLVDSLQGLSAIGQGDRRTVVDEWLYYFRDLKLQNPWLTSILVSEKNRSAYGGAALAGAKESGAIEYQAELVLDLYPDKEDTKILVECTYNRDGDTGVIDSFIKNTPYTFQLMSGDGLEDIT